MSSGEVDLETPPVENIRILDYTTPLSEALRLMHHAELSKLSETLGVWCSISSPAINENVYEFHVRFYLDHFNFGKIPVRAVRRMFFDHGNIVCREVTISSYKKYKATAHDSLGFVVNDMTDIEEETGKGLNIGDLTKHLIGALELTIETVISQRA